MTRKPSDSLADSWLKRVKDRPVVVFLIVVGTGVAAVIGFSQLLVNLHTDTVHSSVTIAGIELSKSSDAYFKEEMFDCRFGGHPVRTFIPAIYQKVNRAVSLDFAFSNNSKREATFDRVVLQVRAAEQVVEGAPGIGVPAYTYTLPIKHAVGPQSFTLRPTFRISGNDTGAVTLVLKPDTEGVDLCWVVRAIFHTSLGDVTTDEFSVIMSNFK